MTLQAPFTRTTPDRSSARTGERGVELTAPHEALVAAARDPRAPLLRRLRLIGAVGRRVVWRGEEYILQPDGRLVAVREPEPCPAEDLG